MKNQKHHGVRRFTQLLAVLVVIGGYASWSLLRPLSTLTPNPPSNTISVDTGSPALAWPAVGQAAVSIVGTNISNTHGKLIPVPTASTAKVVTALVVLNKKPLKAGEAGPTLTMSDADVAIYNNYQSIDGSIVPVAAGEQINERQMLQAIMLPSANNIADSMAIWAYGSLAAYSTAANTYLAAHGLTHTRIGSDASGLSPTTTSTAEDLVKLGKLAMQNPVLVEIVGQSTATDIPMTTSVKNVNSLLGVNNIVGVKTGNTNEAGGVFISASRVTLNNKPVIIVTAIAGSSSLFSALKDSLTLVRSAQANFATLQLVKAGDILGRYQLPQGGSIEAIADNSLKLTTWKSSQLRAQTTLRPVKIKNMRGSAGQAVGDTTIPKSGLTGQQSITISLKNLPAEPSTLWQLTHPF